MLYWSGLNINTLHHLHHIKKIEAMVVAETRIAMAKISTVDEYLESLAEPLRQIGAQLCPLVDAAFPDASGVMWHGHPV